MTQSKSQYDDAFYGKQMDGSYNSAKCFVEALLEYLHPESVVDVGSGRGTWLKAFAEQGVSDLRAYDGDWNTQDDMAHKDIVFTPADLNEPQNIVFDKKYDLAMSLEVAEHLRPDTSEKFVQALTQASDVVMFSAAIEGQGGEGHINEHEQSFWGEIFAAQGYEPYDVFRPRFWGHPDIRFWYQQNVFLFVKSQHPLAETLQQRGISPLANLQFMNLVHPRLYSKKNKPRGLKRIQYKINKIRNAKGA